MYQMFVSWTELGCNDYTCYMYQMFVSWTELGETNIDLSLWLIYRIHALIFHVPFRIQNSNFKFCNRYQWHPILFYYFKVIVAIQYIGNPIWIYIPTLYLLLERFISKVELPI